MKGSDASWEDNNEPPVECLDYSDDEEEKAAKMKLENANQKNIYNHFLPENSQNVESNITASDALPEETLSLSSFIPSKSMEKKLTTKLVGKALARARRKAARTNLADIAVSKPDTSKIPTSNESETNLLSMIQEAVKSDPKMLSSIVSSAMSAAGSVPLPKMLPPLPGTNTPQIVAQIPSCLPTSVQQSLQKTESSVGGFPKKRVDPRFFKAKP